MMTVTVLTKESLNEVRQDILSLVNGIFESKPAKPKKWLRTSELQELLGISPGSLQTLRANGTLKFYKDYGPILYDYEHIDKLLEENCYPPARVGRKKKGK